MIFGTVLIFPAKNSLFMRYNVILSVGYCHEEHQLVSHMKLEEVYERDICIAREDTLELST